eukprot:5584561-Prymnesium_polylepis.1
MPSEDHANDLEGVLLLALAPSLRLSVERALRTVHGTVALCQALCSALQWRSRAPRSSRKCALPHCALPQPALPLRHGG